MIQGIQGEQVKHWQRRRKILLAVTSAALLLVIVWPSVQNYSGYCRSEGRFISDEELIEIAIEYVYENYQRRPPAEFNIHSVYSKEIEERVKYDSLKGFKEANDDCCSISDVGLKGVMASFPQRIYGYSRGYVRVEYSADAAGFTYEDREKISGQYTGYSGPNDPKFETYNQKNLSLVPMSNCGEVWRGH